MPTPEHVDAFIALVESGRTLEAMERFYAEHATMRENQSPPRVGKAALLDHERRALAGIARLTATCVRPVLLAGDTVVIRWVFEIEDRQGRTMRFEELAHQRWDGPWMVEEQFFYDPAQFA